MTEAARDYRLISAALGPASRAPRTREDEERLLATGGVSLVGDACAWVLTTVKRSLGARTVVLAWLDDDGERLKLKDMVSDREQLVQTRLPAAGVLGAVVRDRSPVVLAALRSRPELLRFVDLVRRDGQLVTRARTVSPTLDPESARSSIALREIDELLHAADSEIGQ